jgi:glycosyltransferase involved in cell wall biosynthesis
MNILAVIMCHNSPDTTERLRRELAPVMDVIVLDSGSDDGCRAKKTAEVIYCDNLFWTGCWNYAIELMQQANADVLWVIGGDIELRSEPEEYVKAIEASWPFGCWHPVIDGISRPMMQASHTKTPTNVWHLEGIALAVTKEAVREFKKLPEDNKYGWGLDIWMNWKCWEASMRNVLDSRVKIFHPDLRGYSSHSAHIEMFRWFEKNIGTDYRDKLHYHSDDSEYNKIDEAGRHGVSVVVSSYNQKNELRLSLASLAHQEVLPIEVVVADDGSTDGTVEWLDSLGHDDYPFQIIYITSEHNGYNLVGVYNAAAKIARGSRIIFTNADIIHNHKSIKAHMKVHFDKMGMGYTGVIPLPKSKAVTVEHIKNQMAIDHMVDSGSIVCNARIQGGNFSVPVDIFTKLDGFSRNLFGKYGSETADFIERAGNSGYETTAQTSSCGWHLAHPTRTYKEQQLGNKHFQREHLGVEV